MSVPNEPLPGTNRALWLTPGKYYQVYTRIRDGSGFKHEGHGRFKQLQNGDRDVLFEPFITDTGAVLESQVFSTFFQYYYKIENVKGGSRKSRRKGRKSRKSRRNMRR